MAKYWLAVEFQDRQVDPMDFLWQKGKWQISTDTIIKTLYHWIPRHIQDSQILVRFKKVVYITPEYVFDGITQDSETWEYAHNKVINGERSDQTYEFRA